MVKQINSYQELLEYVEFSFLTLSSMDILDIGDSLDYTIKISGPSWDGSIDYRVARYIIDLQKAFDKLGKDLGIEFDKDSRPVIKFQVREGCLEAIVKISEAVAKIFEGMTGNQKFILGTLTLLVITGGFTGYEISEYKGRQEERQHELVMKSKEYENAERIKVLENAEEKSQIDRELRQQELLVEVIHTVTDKLPEYTAPHRTLIANLGENDTVTNSIDSIKRNRKQLKREYPQKSKVKAETVYIDDKYLVTAVKIKDNRITVEKGTHHYDCIPSLSSTDIDELYTQMKDANNQGKGIELDLKISAEYYKGSNSIKNLNIYEIGGRRNGAKTIDELIGPAK